MKKTFTDAERLWIAKNSYDNSRTITEIAAEHGISERTLRNWRAIYIEKSPGSAGIQMRFIIREAINKLSLLEDALLNLEQMQAWEAEHGPWRDNDGSETPQNLADDFWNDDSPFGALVRRYAGYSGSQQV